MTKKILTCLTDLFSFRTFTFFFILGVTGCSHSSQKNEPTSLTKETLIYEETGEKESRPRFHEMTDADTRFRNKIGTRGVVVSDSEEASLWGAEILKRGGNAVDAAVATALAMSVTRPNHSALGSGGFLLYCPKQKPCQVLDYREIAPKKAYPEMYVKNGKADTHLSQSGALSIGVPGMIPGLSAALKKWGKKRLPELLSRPIALARDGIVMTAYQERAANERWKDLNPEAKKILSVNGESKIASGAGKKFKQLDLAKTLERVARFGEAEMRTGETAKKIVADVSKAGGILSLDDLKNYEPKMRAPLEKAWKGFNVVTMPPPSSGGAIVLQLLEYMNEAEKRGELEQGFSSVAHLHAVASSMSFSFADRAKYMGDPDFVKVPLNELLSSDYLHSRFQKEFCPMRACTPSDAGNLGEVKESNHTTHLSVIDHDGNAVSLTQTLNENYGSGFVARGTGVFLNNEMDDFSISPGTPNLFGLVGGKANQIEAGKKPLSSMTPTIVRTMGGENRLVLGAAGGPRIISAVFQVLMNRVYFGMPLTDSVLAPRIHEQWKPEKLYLERFAFSPETVALLQARGWKIELVQSVAHIHAAELTESGRVWGVNDPRGTGGVAIEMDQ